MSDFGNGDFKTKYGTITIRNPGRKTKPPNLAVLKRVKGRRPVVNGKPVDGPVYTKSAGDVVLQAPALRSFLDAEKRSTKRRLRKKGKRSPIILTGVGYRSYSQQAALYYSSDNVNGRFADPDGSLHVEAIAVDIHTGFLRLLAGIRARKALIALGWHFAVSGEPWHASFHRSG